VKVLIANTGSRGGRSGPGRLKTWSANPVCRTFSAGSSRRQGECFSRSHAVTTDVEVLFDHDDEGAVAESRHAPARSDVPASNVTKSADMSHFCPRPWASTSSTPRPSNALAPTPAAPFLMKISSADIAFILLDAHHRVLTFGNLASKSRWRRASQGWRPTNPGKDREGPPREIGAGTCTGTLRAVRRCCRESFGKRVVAAIA
jgi:hypothetical protein